MSYNQEKYNSKIRLFLGIGLLLGTVCFMYFIQYYFLHFSASKIIPGLTTAAAANGFRLAYKIYKKLKIWLEQYKFFLLGEESAY